jgi:hypothetical protein
MITEDSSQSQAFTTEELLEFVRDQLVPRRGGIRLKQPSPLSETSTSGGPSNAENRFPRWFEPTAGQLLIYR